MEPLLLYSLWVFFLFYLLNHSVILSKPRGALAPITPLWIREMASCAFCATWWFGLAQAFVFGWSYVVICAPPIVLFMDLVFRKLRPPAEHLPHYTPLLPQPPLPPNVRDGVIEPPILPKS